MLVIKPYGRSHVVTDPDGQRRRVIAPRGSPGTTKDIEDFALSYDELVIAQWISTIDKIARKPTAGRPATTEQHEFRLRLGEAAWAHLEARSLVRGLANASTKERLRRLWTVKITPSDLAPRDPRAGRIPPSAKGSWYDRFCDGIENVSDVDVVAVAEKIERHLHLAELRRDQARPPRRLGRIQSRARSIAKNTPQRRHPLNSSKTDDGWSDEDCARYTAAGDVAAIIRSAAEARESGQHPSGKGRVGVDIAATALFQHYALLFKKPDGQTMTIREAQSTSTGLFNLHVAIKDTYSRILKNHQKDKRAHGPARRGVSNLLPSTMDVLFALVDSKRRNRDISSLIRLGKVIHYEASTIGKDNPQNIVHSWPASISTSYFWTSDGQTEIKRSEAFVRVWRHVLVLASRTLTDWAGSNLTVNDDILQERAMARVTGPDFDADMHAKKLDLLFGNKAAVLKVGNEQHQRATLRLALQGLARLRHSVFHFKGFGGFEKALSGIARHVDPAVLKAIHELCASDQEGRSERVTAMAFGAHVSFFFDSAQCQSMMGALATYSPCPLALPRFSRVMRRAANAWSQHANAIGLPDQPSRAQLRDPATYCRFESLRLLYGRPFRAWLHEQDAATLNGYIDRAVTRATVSARDLNATHDEQRRQMIVSKASTLGKLAESERIEHFFSRLSAETASEMRVQRGYESDANRAREQSKYIENLKLDVVALAFSAFLTTMGFDFILSLQPGTPKPELPVSRLAVTARSTAEAPVEDWQAVLYFLAHLVPVEEINRLVHQLQKWASRAPPVASGASDYSGRIQSVLELYRDMHDAKFEGRLSLTGVEPFAALFQNADDFNRLFPATDDGQAELRTSKRGLREIMRFGHLPLLQAILGSHPVMHSEVAEYLTAEALNAEGASAISELQLEREALHDRWKLEQRSFPAPDRARYKAVLRKVSRHRHLASKVTLTDHVKLHRLLMAVWGRLLDFAGLWERDLYFALLALLDEAGTAPSEALNGKGLRLLGNGQIVPAVRDGELPLSIRDALTPHFTGVWKPDSRAAKIRNKLAHIDIHKSQGGVDLTFWVNLTRELMAHDRKLKNAVSQSVKELLHRENLDLSWDIEQRKDRHEMAGSTLRTCQAFHLGGRSISEDLHGEEYVRMAAALFGRCKAVRPPEIIPRRADGAPRDGSKRARR